MLIAMAIGSILHWVDTIGLLQLLILMLLATSSLMQAKYQFIM
jgi:hypothetical protein